MTFCMLYTIGLGVNQATSSTSTLNDPSENIDIELSKTKTGLGFSIAGGVGTWIEFSF